MTAFPYLDPLSAAKVLLDNITGNDGRAADISELARLIDAFMYSSRFLRTDAVPSVLPDKAEPQDITYESLRSIIGARYPMLGLYWNILNSRVDPSKDPEIGAGDAIDDLSDIAREFTNVEWYKKNCGRDEAMASLRWYYEFHLWMHLVPLRSHLEDEMFQNCA